MTPAFSNRVGRAHAVLNLRYGSDPFTVKVEYSIVIGCSPIYYNTPILHPWRKGRGIILKLKLKNYNILSNGVTVNG